VLSCAKEKNGPREPVQLRSTFENVGKTPLALTFWWNRNMRVTDARGNIVPPDPGPERPCGVGEDPTVLEPGKSLSRVEPLACTQPSGAKDKIGWSYKLKPGTYKIALVFEAPPAHGFGAGPHDGNDAANPKWKGKVISNEVTVVIE
jgi:hypothetical protein